MKKTTLLFVGLCCLLTMTAFAQEKHSFDYQRTAPAPKKAVLRTPPPTRTEMQMFNLTAPMGIQMGDDITEEGLLYWGYTTDAGVYGWVSGVNYLVPDEFHGIFERYVFPYDGNVNSVFMYLAFDQILLQGGTLGSVGVLNPTGNVNIRIYKDNNPSSPGVNIVQVVNQQVSLQSLANQVVGQFYNNFPEGWAEINFDAPAAVTKNTIYYVGIDFTNILPSLNTGLYIGAVRNKPELNNTHTYRFCDETNRMLTPAQYGWGSAFPNSSAAVIGCFIEPTIPPYDLAVTGFVAPDPAQSIFVNLSTEEQVTVKVKNLGTQSIAGTELYLYLDGEEVAAEGYYTAIPAGDEFDYSFTTPIDLSAGGLHTLRVEVLIEEADDNAGNDFQEFTYGNAVCGNYRIPDTIDFEGLKQYCWDAVVPDANNQNLFELDIVSSGNHYLRFSSWAHGSMDYSQLYISHELPATDGNIEVSFDYFHEYPYPQNGGEGDAFGERFYFGYSVTGNDPADFIWDEQPTIIPTKEDMTIRRYVNAAVPEGTKYVCIRYATNAGSFLNIDNIIINGVMHVSIKDKVNNTFSVYPNPTTGLVNIDVMEKSAVNIYDASGKLVKSLVAMPNTTNALELSTGAYFVTVGQQVTKVIVK